MPKEAIFAMAGVIGFMVIFGIFMATRSVKKARGVVDAQKKGLEELGLRMVTQDGARSRSEGTYRGNAAWLETDGSAIMQAAGGAMAIGLVAEFVSPALSTETRENLNRKLDRMARSGMQSAPMQLRFGMKLPKPSSSNLEVRKDAAPPVGGADVVSALASAQFDVITVQGDTAYAIWTPENREYQKQMASGGFAAIADQTLGALHALGTAIASE